MESYSPTDFGVLGVVLIFSWKVIELLGSIARKKLNGHASTPCEDAIQRLAITVEAYVDEHRKANTELIRTAARQSKQIEDLWTAHLGPAAIDPASGTPRWWSH